jgi:hypothetical protein
MVTAAPDRYRRRVEAADGELVISRVDRLRPGPGRAPRRRRGLLAAAGRIRSGWTPVDSLAVLLTGLHLVALLVLLSLGSFYLDDLRAQGYAQGQPFERFVVGSNGTHFAPLPRTLDWLQARYLPLMHAPAVAVTLVVRLLLAVAFWRLLRRLVGARPAALVPFSVLLFTPALLPATAWYRQSITVLACTVAMVWALDAQLRYHAQRRWTDLTAVVVATAIGLACYEKAALIPLVLLASSVLLLGRGRRPSRWWQTIRPGLVPVLASSAVVAGFLLVYRTGPYDRGAASLVTPAQVFELTWRTVGEGVAPQLLGIGWPLSYPSPYFGVVQATTGWLVVAGVVAGLALLPALLRHPGRVLRALAFGSVWTFGSVTLVAIGRYPALGLLLVDATRLWADLVPGLLIAATLAVLPWQFGSGPPGPPVTPVPATAGSRPVRSGAVRRIRPALIGTGVAAAMVGSALGWQQFAAGWWQNPTGDWISAARTSLAAAEDNPRIVPRPLPETVLPSWAQPTFPFDRPLISLLRPDARFEDGDGPALALSGHGRLGPYFTVPLGGTAAGPGCVATLTQGREVTIPLPTPVIYRSGALVEVAVLLDRPTGLEISLVGFDGRSVLAERWPDSGTGRELAAGPHTVRVPLPVAIILRGVALTAPGVGRSCLVSIKVWAAYS